MHRYADDYGGWYDAGFSGDPRTWRARRPPPPIPYDRYFAGARGDWARPTRNYGWNPGGRGPENFDNRRPQRRGGYGYASQAGPSHWGRAQPDGAQRGESAVDIVRVADIMTRNPDAVTPDTTIAEVARRMRDLDVGVIPVIDSDDSRHLEGVVTDRDIAVRAAADGKDMKKTPVREVMSPDPQTVLESDHVRDVFAVMKRARVRRVPVVGADGSLVGIVAQADLAVNYAGLDLQRETEVEEVIEKISEPARPRWGRESDPGEDRRRMFRRFRPSLEVEMPDRVRSGWRVLRREARELLGRRYDRGWR